MTELTSNNFTKRLDHDLHLEHLSELVDNDIEFYEELRLLVIREVPSRLEEIQNFVESEDRSSLQRLLQSFRDSVGNIGASLAYDTMLKIEAHFERDDFYAIRKLIPTLQKELEPIVEYFSQKGWTE